MHSHDHSHQGSGDNASKRIGWAFFLNVVFTIIEFIGGWLTNSTAIMADAVHDLGDSLSIGTAWILNKLSDKEANNTFSYGYKRFSLLGALINGLVLTVGSVWILFEAIPRLAAPEMPHAEGMLLLSIFGMAVNGFAAYKLSDGDSLNERVLNWHLLEDVLGWVAVFIVSVVLMFKPWPILDPILSIGFTLFILFNVVRNLKETLLLFLQATPDSKQVEKVRSVLLSKSEVDALHHFHIWSLDGEQNVMTAHLVLTNEATVSQIQTLKRQLQEELAVFEFVHTTIELEFADEQCRDDNTNA
ncbi:cation diffusion facilitator family transporter [Brumicola pallidula]|uniref:Cation efflux system protein, CDF family n=1 Tax=Brumicola pallidula DSM 14239 = ACAM 615 TaxID=1121922 RepID=K6Z0W6_9ALTE|nr:cation diffusion facilitator family transporter [Glaciecola pallidula]GAC29801.1 cation efflux system protein, CDF family [Glaciecola pallidula DSM 14239 = ACAM 615]